MSKILVLLCIFLDSFRRKNQIMRHLEDRLGRLDNRIGVMVLIGQLLFGYKTITSFLNSLCLHIEELDVIEETPCWERFYRELFSPHVVE